MQKVRSYVVIDQHTPTTEEGSEMGGKIIRFREECKEQPPIFIKKDELDLSTSGTGILEGNVSLRCTAAPGSHQVE